MEKQTNIPVISIKDVSRFFVVGDSIVKALDNVSLSINKGEFTSIMGPSGSGKSTMMNLIGCLDTPTSGKVFIGGEYTADMNEAELAYIRNQKIGFVFQQFNLLSKLNAIENVMTPLLYARVPLSRRREMAEEALIKVGLKERMRHRPNELSGGQKQRVAIARAIVTQPDIILADEPTGALDTRTGNQIMNLFAELHNENNTIVIVTHNDEIGKSCPRMVRIRDGKIEGEEYNVL